MLGKRLCVVYSILFIKQLNSSRHHVHYLVDMSDGLSLGKVQGQKLPISIHDLSKDVLSIVCQHYHLHTNNQFSIHVGDCWTKTVFFKCKT